MASGIESKAQASANGGGPAPPIERIDIRPLEEETVVVPVEGVTELIMHNWSAKARQMMLAKHQGKATPKKEPKVPEDEFEAAKYKLADGSLGMPATAFKVAIVDAARWFESVTMEDLKRAVRVVGEGPEQLVRVKGECRMREDTPRLSGPGRTPDLRYRPAVFPWSTELTVIVVKAALTTEALIHLVNAAGLGGVGDWRPSSPRSKSGVYGTFRVREG